MLLRQSEEGAELGMEQEGRKGDENEESEEGEWRGTWMGRGE